MLKTHLSLLTLVLCTAVALAAPSKLAFKPAGEGLFEFDTGVLRGRLKLDGRFMGIYPLIDVASGTDMARPPGVLSPYRVFETNKRYGNAARDWPTVTKVLPDGAVEARWPAAKGHPIEMTALYRWAAADTLDVETTVKPQNDMPRFELFMSSYFLPGFRASVYLKRPGEAAPAFVPVDRKPGSKGGYVMFPRDEGAVAMIQDGRWKIPPSAVDWGIERWLAAPLAMRRDAALGVTAVMMCPTGECFAISSPWNPATPKGGGYRSLYHSLFGLDLKAGQAAIARCRLVIARGLSDEQAVKLYEAYLKEPRR